MKNFNFSMGRYYAWLNLSQSVKSFIKKHTFTPYYNFKYIPPKVDSKMKFLPYEQWGANKARDRSLSNVVLIAVACLSYILSKFVYQVLYDEDKGYYYHINYPIICKLVQVVYTDVQNWLGPFLEITPKDKYEVVQIYARLFELVFKTKERIVQNDRKVYQLRAEMAQYDQKHRPVQNSQVV